MHSPRVIILGAGRPFAGESPTALQPISGEKQVLDWLLNGFEEIYSDPEFHFVGGYRLEDVIEEYPMIHFSRNERWEETGTVGSLFAAPINSDRPTYVCYADTIFETDVIAALADGAGDASIGVDLEWRTRYDDRDAPSLERAEKVSIADGSIDHIGRDIPTETANGEFTGLLYLSPDASEHMIDLFEMGKLRPTDDMPALVRAFTDELSVETVDIGDSWAELESPEDIAQFVLDTKANTLRRLASMVERSTILDQYTFEITTWKTDPVAVYAAIEESFGERRVIVRSSSTAEDTWNSSSAGQFESVLDVPATDPASLQEAIQTVADSYPSEDGNEQVLVQPMVTNVTQSGVVMTRSIDAYSPYYVINYDPETSRTDSVTDGNGDSIETALIRRDCVDDVDSVTDPSRPQSPTNLEARPLVAAVRELEELVNHDALDIEFAIDDSGDVFVLQVRPITLDPAERSTDDEQVLKAIENAEMRFQDEQPPSPPVVGDRTVFGVMPDWNPAEIIGRRPNRLAASLYRFLVTDDIWARQRAELGYRDVRPHPLMKSYAGQPYIDVRAVFNSFVPADVPDELAEKLVTFYLDRLEANPELHDKVEFDIALTCLVFDFDGLAQPLREAGFTDPELRTLREALGGITQNAFERVGDGRDERRISTLASRYDAVMEADLSKLRTARFLLEDCREYGTLPFAHLARSAFIAVSLLRSLQRTGHLSDSDVSAFLSSLNTVARQFERDGHRVATDDLAWDAFVDRYGHLRPGTYDVTSPTYASEPDRYLRPVVEANRERSRGDPDWSDVQRDAVEAELAAIGLPEDFDRLVEFLRNAIEGREHAKFVFSRNLSAAIECIATYGQEQGLSRVEVGHVSVGEYLELLSSHPPTDPGEWLSDRVEEGRTRETITRAVELPALVTCVEDFRCFRRSKREANYVTTKSVRGEITTLDGDDAPQLDGQIVAIPQADPGYDWLFGYDIAGLITMYGGSNSHMAIRAAEFDLPAAIGVGQSMYETLRDGVVAELDCGNMTIRQVNR